MISLQREIADILARHLGGEWYNPNVLDHKERALVDELLGNLIDYGRIQRESGYDKGYDDAQEGW